MSVICEPYKCKGLNFINDLSEVLIFTCTTIEIAKNIFYDPRELIMFVTNYQTSCHMKLKRRRNLTDTPHHYN